MASRREFIAHSLTAAALAAFPVSVFASTGRAVRPLKLLVLGGTGFLGPHFVERAHARGHTLTLFNRGRSHPERFDGTPLAGIEQLRGDRKDDLAALEGDRRWDAVLDTSAYFPDDVARSATLLAGRIGRYQIISSISVYARNDIANDEDSSLATLDDPTTRTITGETYGGLKAACERAAQTALPDRTSVVRPGLIVGPGDPTDRFTYWPARADRGGEIAAPGAPGNPTQCIDVRDLATFLLHLIERDTTGVFNADAAPGTLDMGRLLDSCLRQAKAAGGASDARLTWLPADFLEAQNVKAWSDMPVWIAPAGDYAGFGRTRVDRAMAAGLTYRPIDDTVRDTLVWWRDQPAERRAALKSGLTPQREAEVLAAWHARSL
ncbi:NAD-dependent epimerase/dehydratase family protein [Luteimonas terrae]|uniref:2'-hydroxyisoflavone reductase n=1 Tax=Luteimonas terrae TaxID=1530191 RepID=A0ABU1XS84_9GAMM|nr:NAD-dependent epimerase/dehydratase family protein [Luteimonas terrae]MDR7191622.1 2'-hydroxyisoflavone reductase [Luteimonas terrae]